MLCSTALGKSCAQGCRTPRSKRSLAGGAVRWELRRSRRRAAACSAAEVDVSIRVKIMLAEGSSQLDLSEKGLDAIPESVFELTGLEELSLAGNNLTEVPDAMAKLTSLRLLQLSGNQLRALPDALCTLPQLQGLWLGGNLLPRLPPTLSGLSALTSLSAPGNVLTELPASLGALSALQTLALAGNALTALPAALTRLGSLRKLELHGNAVAALPEGMGALTALTQLALQGNALTELPEDFSCLKALEDLNVADNALSELPAGLGRLASLKQLTVYGNRLRALAQDLVRLPSLQGLWAEANPLPSLALLPLAAELTATVGSADDAPRRLGVDTEQVAGFPEELRAAAGKRLQVGEIIGTGPGYFKLARGAQPARPGGIVDAAGAPGERVLVVSFSSAPGVPNWGSALRRVAKAADDPAHACFDVLFVVDTGRGWYSGGDQGFTAWHERLALATRRYSKVMMVGDSMVDMSAASLRPGRDLTWLAALRERLLHNVRASSAAITAYVGSFLHDIDQAKLLPEEHVQLKVYTCDSHRLAFILDQRGKLVPLLRAAILSEMGYRANNVRLGNLV